MHKWEYLFVREANGHITHINHEYIANLSMVFSIGKGTKAQELFNQLGIEGWELVGMVDTGGAINYVLKRELQ